MSSFEVIHSSFSILRHGAFDFWAKVMSWYFASLGLPVWVVACSLPTFTLWSMTDSMVLANMVS